MKRKNITKEQLYNLYIEQNLSSEEICSILDIERSTFFRKIKKFNIKKSDELKSDLLKRSNVQKIHLDEQAVIKYYINENHTAEETALYFNVSEPTIRRVLQRNNIYKDACDAQKNREKIILEKYGVKSAFLQDNAREKANVAAWSNEAREKRYSTNLDKYGGNPTKNNIVREKIRKTNLSKYGVECVLQSEVVKAKIRKTNLIKYGTENCSTAILTNEARIVLKNKDNFIKYLQNCKSKIVYDISKELGCSTSTIIVYLNKYDLWDLIDKSETLPEKWLFNLLDKWGVKHHKTKKILSPLEIDAYCEDYKIGIEINGDYWHSSIKKNKEYHFNKSKLASEKGIRLIHIWEYEWKDPNKRKIIESLLQITFGKVENRIYARNCEIKMITNEEAAPFNNANHLQGHRNAQITYGLFYNNKLVQLMSFSKTKYNHNIKDDNTWEIIRGCPGSNNIVVGGVSKLFKHFIKDYNPSKIFSYCDFNKFDGRGYEELGMKFIGYTGPDMKWLMSNGDVIPRKPSKHKELKEKSVAQIWGAGSKKYIWGNPTT